MSTERLLDLIVKNWPDHQSCLKSADAFTDPDHGVVCGGCGAILGHPEEDPPAELEHLAEFAGGGNPEGPEQPPDALERAIRRLDAENAQDPDTVASDPCGVLLMDEVWCRLTAQAEFYGYCSSDHAVLAAHQVLTGSPSPQLMYAAQNILQHQGVRPPAVVDVHLPEGEPQPEYAVGDTVTVGGIPFTKHSEMPFPDEVFGAGPIPLHAPDDEAQGSWMDDPAYQAAAREGFESNPAAVAYAQAYAAGERDARAEQAQAPAPFPTSAMPERPADVVPAEDPLNSRVVVIDPSQPYTPADVEAQLVEVLSKLERGMHFQRYWEERAYAAEVAWTMANARAVAKHRSSGAADVRKAMALLDCQREYEEMALCGAMVRAVRETMHSLRSLQHGYQTTSNSVRAHYQGTR